MFRFIAIILIFISSLVSAGNNQNTNEKGQREILYKGIYCKLVYVKLVDLLDNEKAAEVKFKLQNRSNKYITNLDIKIYFIGKNGKAIYEILSYVIYKSNSTYNNRLLKPNYITEVTSYAKGAFLEDWVVGKIRFKLVNIKFSDGEPLSSLDKTRVESVNADIRLFKIALEVYRLQTDTYLSTKQGLQAIIDEKLLKNKKDAFLDP